MKRYICIIALLTACQATDATQTRSDPPNRTEGNPAGASCADVARRANAMRGTPLSDIDLTGPGGRRVLAPNVMATADLIPDRLTLSVDMQRRLTSATCG